MIIEIATLAKPAFLRLPRDVRRAISTKAQEIAQGKTQGTMDHGGGVFSFRASGGIVVYVSVEIGFRVTIEHIVG
jgi:transketolase C-terminal domain/subunit